MRIPILGVPFDALTLNEAAESARKMIAAGHGGMIATVNPEILLLSRRDRDLAESIGRADLILADGIGVVLASRLLHTPLPERVAGADLTPRLLEALDARRGSVFLYGARPGVAERAAHRLEREYPGVRVAGVEDGYGTEAERVRREIARARSDLLLVGLGAPRQERFMAQNRDSLGPVMISVGGLLDVMAGDVKRAPELWQKVGAEWLYRLYQQPERIKRVAGLPRILTLCAAERWKNGTPKGPAS